MFTTSLTAALLGGLLSSGSLETPKWRTSYQDAAQAAASLRKPIAVFITAGSPAKLMKEGSLNLETAKLLREGYIPLTVDTGTAAGQQLATTFKMSEGLVISDRSGGVQALRHAGAVSGAELKGYLKQYAAPTATVITTDYRGVAPVASIAPTVRPAYQAPQYQPQVYQPQVNQQYQQQSAYQQPQYQQYEEYSRPRPVLNAMQNVGGFVQNVGQSAVQSVGGFVQNVGGFRSGST